MIFWWICTALVSLQKSKQLGSSYTQKDQRKLLLPRLSLKVIGVFWWQFCLLKSFLFHGSFVKPGHPGTPPENLRSNTEYHPHNTQEHQK